MKNLYFFFVFVFGLIVGSFLNVCIYRLPKGIFFKKQFSFCTHCEKRIRWFDNIPLLSYIFLKGKCRYCQKKISFIYPLVELLTGSGFLLFYLKWGLTAYFFIGCLFLSLLIVATWTDFKERIIPDEISLGGLALGFILSIFFPFLHESSFIGYSVLDSFLGILIGGGSLYITGILGALVLKKEAMGGGDVKLLAMIGAFWGWKLSLFTFFLAPCLAIIPGICQLIFKKEHTLPYGPFLAFTSLVALLFLPDVNIFVKEYMESLIYMGQFLFGKG